MRKSLFVTDTEYILHDDATLMSTTDTRSYITYTNESFIEASGFESDELIGQPHNLVRHPDMPAQVFEDMWATLKKGEPWTGLVKNRRKNGDFYWVRANAVPIVRNNQTQGFMSIRTKASREEIEEAQRIYQAMNSGRLKGWRFHRGLLVRRGAGALLTPFRTLSLRWRLRVPLLALLAASCWLRCCWASGWKRRWFAQWRKYASRHYASRRAPAIAWIIRSAPMKRASCCAPSASWA